ncbi:MAG: hypothetical protein KDF59_16375 [Nitrosomonas sp.]|nr:hypothetical protein [Nitrosomonas sp.]
MKETSVWRKSGARCDPFETVWKAALVPLLAKEPGLTGATLWEYLGAVSWTIP